MGKIEESIDKLWDFSRKLCGEDRLDIRHRIDELEAENERLREALIWINNQLPINSALKPHIAAALTESEGE